MTGVGTQLKEPEYTSYRLHLAGSLLYLVKKLTLSDPMSDLFRHDFPVPDAFLDH
jgi:hypothetical protein